MIEVENQLRCSANSLKKKKSSQPDLLIGVKDDKSKICEKKFGLGDLEEVDSLGRGAFGEVKLVIHKTTKTPYAMKTLRKEDLSDKKAIEQIKNEKNILKYITNTDFNLKPTISQVPQPKGVQIGRNLKIK